MNTSQRVGRLLGAFLTGSLCLVLLGTGLLQYRDMRALDDHGITIEVPIVDNLATRSGKGGMHYEIMYQFNAPTQPKPIFVFQRETVTQEAYERLKVGQRIRVQYLPENPHVTRMLEPGRDDMSLNLVAVTLLMGGIAVLFAYAAVTGKGLLA